MTSVTPYQGTAPKNPSQDSISAEHQLKRAYNALIDAETLHLWNKPATSFGGITISEVVDIYKHAFREYRDDHWLSAERWAHTTQHLAKALWHEAKIDYLEPRAPDLPFLKGATAEDYDLQNIKSDTTADLLDSVAQHVPPGLTEMPKLMCRCLVRGWEHLGRLDDPEYRHELLRAERIKAAHHYGRVLECMALAYATDHGRKIG